MHYVWLALAFLVGVMGVAVGRFLHLSTATTVTVSAVASFLVQFRFLKRWMAKMTFGYWILTAAIGVVVGWSLYLGLSRLGF
jgi:hypothetical protein